MLAALEKFPAGLELPFASRLRFGVIDREKVRAENLFSTGSYGMIKGVRFYLAALVARTRRARWEDIGFALEAAVLYATALELGSCWIGGIFDRRNFGQSAGHGRERDAAGRGGRGPAGGPPFPARPPGALERQGRPAQGRPSLFFDGTGPAAGRSAIPAHGRAVLEACAWPRRLPTSSPGASSMTAAPFIFSSTRQGLRRIDASRRPAAHRHGHRHVPLSAGGRRAGTGGRVAAMEPQIARYAG